MTLKEQLTLAAGREMTVTVEEQQRVTEISARVPGWSGCAHYAFFKELLALPVTNVLMLGVYHGRDMAFMADILAHYHSPDRDIEVTGVDRFTADPCADWAPTNKVRTWEEEAKAPPPSFDAASRNVAHDERFRVIRSDDFTFLDTTVGKFDAVYFDTAHDFNTVVRQLRQVERIAAPGAILCGDDFSDQYTWGVRSAVEGTFSNYLLFAGWIWASFLADKKGVDA